MGNQTPSAADLLRAVAGTLEERNAIYKDNYKLVGPLMTALFPEGVVLKTPHDFIRWHLLELMVVKLTRYARSWTQGGHADSMVDIAGYAAMIQKADAEAREEDDGLPADGTDWRCMCGYCNAAEMPRCGCCDQLREFAQFKANT